MAEKDLTPFNEMPKERHLAIAAKGGRSNVQNAHMSLFKTGEAFFSSWAHAR